MGGGNRPRSAASLRHQTFDSNCIDVRVRGNAWQVHEKYLALARDAQSSGDRVVAENYLQHAEHYFRIIEAINEATALEQRQHPGSSPAPFGQQPDVPANYYGGSGSGATADSQGAAHATGAGTSTSATAPAASDSGASDSVSDHQQAPRHAAPPSSPNPFFGPEEMEDAAAAQLPLAARR